MNLLESLAKRLSTEWKLRKTAERLSHAYHCRCGAAIFFPNTQCLSCKSPLGILPDTLTMVALDPGPESGTMHADGSDRLHKYCGNRDTPALCNWLMEARDPSSLCIACHLNRTIPNLDHADNARYWSAIEAAGRATAERYTWAHIARRLVLPRLRVMTEPLRSANWSAREEVTVS